MESKNKGRKEGKIRRRKEEGRQEGRPEGRTEERTEVVAVTTVWPVRTFQCNIFSQ
jgi:hypothetical protein